MLRFVYTCPQEFSYIAIMARKIRNELGTSLHTNFQHKMYTYTLCYLSKQNNAVKPSAMFYYKKPSVWRSLYKYVAIYVKSCS